MDTNACAIVDKPIRKDLPCANPELIAGYAAIEDILQGDSNDFGRCSACGIVLCHHALGEKREDPSYKVLVQHFRDGGAINQPINYDPHGNRMGNGHHRLAAALDAGFTHIPYQTNWGADKWEGVDLAKYGFKMNPWRDGIVVIVD